MRTIISILSSLRAATVIAIFLSTGLAAHADTIGTFQLTGTLANGASISGVISYDYDSYSASSLTYTSTLNGVTTSYTYHAVADGYYGIATHVVNFGYSNDPGALELYFSGDGTFGTLCTDQQPCTLASYTYVSRQFTGVYDYATNSYTSIDFVSDVPATTPEPSSITLLGSGLFGVAGVVRRRLA